MDAPEPTTAATEDARPAIPATVLASAIQELSWPLDRIADFAQLCMRSLRAAPGPSDCLSSVEEIRVLALRARRRVRNIAHYSRLERAEFGSVDMNRLAEDCRALLEPELRQQGVSLKLEPSSELPYAKGNVAHLRHALANLIENGAEAMAAVEPEQREVSVATRLNSEGVVIEVRDRGTGIPPELQDRVFDPFYTTKGRGMGLGLTVVRMIVRQHSGMLTVGRRAGGGMAIRLSVPIVGLQARGPAGDSSGLTSDSN